MARITAALKVKTTTTPKGGALINLYNFQNVGVVGGDIGTQAAATAVQMGSISAQMATVVTNAGTNAGTLGVTTLASLVATGSADVASLNTAVVQDVTVTWNTATVTSVTQLRRAFDRIINLAQGGVGGMTP